MKLRGSLWGRGFRRTEVLPISNCRLPIADCWLLIVDCISLTLTLNFIFSYPTLTSISTLTAKSIFRSGRGPCPRSSFSTSSALNWTYNLLKLEGAPHMARKWSTSTFQELSITSLETFSIASRYSKIPNAVELFLTNFDILIRSGRASWSHMY